MDFSVTRERMRRRLSPGVLLQILLLLVSAIFYVARTEMVTREILRNQNEMMSKLEEVRVRSDHIEKYLSSRDPHYWQSIKELENSARGSSRVNSTLEVQP